MRLPRLDCLVAFACVATALRAAPFDDRIETLFRPPLDEMITLSPDGQRVAYTSRSGRELSIVIMNIEPPGPKKTIKVELNRDPTRADEPAPRLRFLRWATNKRLVYAPFERSVPLPPLVDKAGRSIPNPDGPTIVSPILAIDVDGKPRGTIVDASNFQETPEDARKTLADFLRTTKELQATRNEPVRWRMPHLEILGFLPRDREQLIIQTRGAYSQPAQHLVDLRTGSVSEFGDWPAPPGEPLVFDAFRLKVVGERKDASRPTTAWRDEELARVQRELEGKFSRRVVEILDWSETRARVLFRVTGGSDAGRVFVYQKIEDIVLEILPRAPGLSAAQVHETRFFDFTASDGAHLSGYMTWPRQPRVNPPPLLVVFPMGFPGHAQQVFDPEAQVFADLGCGVVRLNHRSVAGVRPEDLNPLRTAIDRMPVDDARAVLDWIAAQNPGRPFDRQRVVTFGRGFGGYLALRALQLRPAEFRCGIALDAPMELQSWVRPAERSGASGVACDIPVALVGQEGASADKFSVVAQAETLSKRVLLVVEPKGNPAVAVSTAELRTRLQKLGRPVGYLELDPDFVAGQPAARAAAYQKIDEFLEVSLQDHPVNAGPPKEAK